jgi:hypothetical protein
MRCCAELRRSITQGAPRDYVSSLLLATSYQPDVSVVRRPWLDRHLVAIVPSRVPRALAKKKSQRTYPTRW